jgi:hypothetical protein
MQNIRKLVADLKERLAAKRLKSKKGVIAAVLRGDVVSHLLINDDCGFKDAPAGMKRSDLAADVKVFEAPEELEPDEPLTVARWWNDRGELNVQYILGVSMRQVLGEEPTIHTVVERHVPAATDDPLDHNLVERVQ